MNPFEMIVLIVAIIMIASVIKSRARAQAARPGDAAETQALYGEVARLQERVQVLERLAIDQSRRLASEIDGLRS